MPSLHGDITACNFGKLSDLQSVGCGAVGNAVLEPTTLILSDSWLDSPWFRLRRSPFYLNKRRFGVQIERPLWR